MEAKDTVMSSQQVQKILDKWNDIDSKEMAYATNARPSILDLVADIVVAQAEISFKAGYLQGNKDTHKIATRIIEEKFEEGHKAGIKEVVEWLKFHLLIEPDNNSITRFEPFYQIGQSELKKWGTE